MNVLRGTEVVSSAVSTATAASPAAVTLASSFPPTLLTAKVVQLSFNCSICIIALNETHDVSLTLLIIRSRSVAKSVGCFQRRLFVCLSVNTIGVFNNRHG